MPRLLNRLLALPIDDQNALSAALEVRISVKVAEAVESGAYKQGVETMRADSLVLESREPVFVHDASGAATELRAVVRLDRLSPLTADEALRMQSEALAAGRTARMMANPRSGRAALVSHELLGLRLDAFGLAAAGALHGLCDDPGDALRERRRCALGRQLRPAPRRHPPPHRRAPRRCEPPRRGHARSSGARPEH